jgi:hypothetical protein
MVLPFSVIYTICTPDQRFVFPSAVFNSLLAELWKKLCQRENRKAPGHLLQGILNVKSSSSASKRKKKFQEFRTLFVEPF